MKCTIILIATVFLIGISVSDAAKAKSEAAGGVKKESPEKGGKKESARVAEKDKDVDDDDQDVDQDVDQVDDEADAEADAEAEVEADAEAEAEEVQEKQTPKKKPSSNKKSSAKAARKKQFDDDNDDEEEIERPKRKPKKKPTLSDLTNLKDQAASMNPANLIAALQNTPVEELKKVLPQMKKLTNMLDKTPMGPIFQNLTSLMGNSSPQMWTQVLQVFPDFVATIIGSAAKLSAVGAVAFGRGTKSAVDIADTLFNSGKELLGTVTALPGGNLLTPLNQALDVAHSTVGDTLDSVADELTASGKRSLKRAERSMKRRTGGGGLLGGDAGGLFGFGTR